MNRIDKKDLKLVLLYGSLAKGTYTQYSDIDLLCVFDKAFENPKERFLASYKYSDGLVQPKTLTYNELKEGLIEGNSFLHSIFDHGFILFDKIPKDDLNSWIKEGSKKLSVRFLPPS